ncbi:MAG: DUF2007 domain-containing protein [Magnetococcales bacterium]|nr:DUF2007 domain-containing protein [Magnetococcales bacterium]
MVELFKTNNPIELSWARAVLEEAGIKAFVFDQNINMVEGNLGVFPRRLMVDEENLEQALSLLHTERKALENISTTNRS